MLPAQQMDIGVLKKRSLPEGFFQRTHQKHIVSGRFHGMKGKPDGCRVGGRLHHLLADALELLLL